MTTPRRGQMIWFRPPLSESEWAGRVMSIPTEDNLDAFEVYVTIAPEPKGAIGATLRVFPLWVLPNEGRKGLCECCGQLDPTGEGWIGNYPTVREMETASRHTNNWRPTKLHEECLAQYMRQTGREVRNA